ncbi:MAG: ribbon-helix-helix protein, CopG family [Coriobacteriales bacterium]|nr:ribbon-helix-helix protein, CopG family [Coriobacteriales bacterium]
MAFKVPQSSRDKLDVKAKEANETRSQLMRRILDKALAS